MAFTGKKGDGGNFEQPDLGLAAAVCTRIIDWGTQNWGSFGPKRRVQIVWEIAQENSKGERMSVSKMYTLSFNEKANLMKDLESWRGKNYGKSEDVDLLAVLGKPCMLNMVKQDGDSDYVNVGSISPMMKGMMPLTASETLVFNLDDPDWDTFDQLHEKTQEKIADSPEYKAAMGQKAAPPAATARQASKPQHYPKEEAVAEAVAKAAPDFDDDIPF